MKKRFFVLIIVVMMIFVSSVTVIADEVSAESAIPVVDESAETNNSLFSRVFEFVSCYSGESISVVTSAVLLVLNLILKRSNNKLSSDTKGEFSGIKDSLSETISGQTSIVNVVNDMIDGYNGLTQSYNDMKKSYDQYGAAEDDRNRFSGAVLATNMAILEILTTVYANSKNLPQGVKDLVMLRYANCLKSLENDTLLAAIVDAVRTNLGSSVSVADTETEISNTEV